MKKTFLTLVILTWATSGLADTVDQKIDQLKINAENSEKNLVQYDGNLKTVETNIKEIETAIGTLQKQRKQIKSNLSKAEQNKKEFDKKRQVLDGYIKVENAKVASEDIQVEKLKKRIEEIQMNQQKRRENVTTYNAKLIELNQQEEEWKLQREQAAVIEVEIDKKEKVAVVEKDKWLEKRKSYKTEVEKWGKESRTAASAYKRYKKLDSE